MKQFFETAVCLISTALAWISIQNVQVMAAIGASIIAIISGSLAGVHWYYSIQEKRLNIKKLNEK